MHGIDDVAGRNLPTVAHFAAKCSLLRHTAQIAEGWEPTAYPEYTSSTTVQSSLSGVPPQKFATAEKISSSVSLLAATVSSRESSKKSPRAFSASVTPSVTRIRRSPACRLQ